MVRSRLVIGAAAFDRAPSESAVIAVDGTVLAVNRAWRQFGERNGAGSTCGPGANYLQVTERAAEAGDEVAAAVLAALTAVRSGHAPRARMDYPCHGPDGPRWFRLHAEPLPGRSDLLLVHDDITGHVLAGRWGLDQVGHGRGSRPQDRRSAPRDHSRPA